MNELSLMTILGNDPEFGRRIAKKVQEIKQDKTNLLNAADDYGNRYKNEILAGTEKRNRMLTEGSQRGLSEQEVMSQYNGFLPTVYTPLLNMLYFMLRESDNDPHYGSQHYENRNKLNEQFGHLREDDVKSAILKEPPEMVEFLYGEASLEQFNTIKKLKALSANNNNLEEATAAFRKGRELCIKLGLEWEKIPCYVGKKK